MSSLLIYLLFFSDCEKKDAVVDVIVNKTGNATFYIQLNDTDDFIEIVFYRMSEEMTRWIARVYVGHSDTLVMHMDSIYIDRFSAVITTESTKTKDILATLSAVDVADAGIYGAMITHPKLLQKCFTLYVLGEMYRI